MSGLYQIFCACSLWTWLSSAMAAMQYICTTELYILLASILQLEQRKILRPSNGRLASPSKIAALRPVFHCLPEPNRAWLLVFYFSR